MPSLSSCLQERVLMAAEAVLQAQGRASALDVLVELGWLYPRHVDLWLRRHEAYLFIEEHMQSTRTRRIKALGRFRSWAQAKGLVAMPQCYRPKTLRRTEPELQISPEGDPELEALYRLGFATPGEAQRQAVARKAPAAPELLAFTVFRDELCSECRRALSKGDLVVMDGMKPVCLQCADLDHLVFLPSGDAALTRRARKHSSLAVAVLEFNRRRGVQQRRGLLVLREAIEQAEAECLADEEVRNRRRARDAERRSGLDTAYLKRMTARIRELYPRCPLAEAAAIAEHTCARGSGRVGRSAAAKELDAEAVALAVQAYVRHTHTPYDRLLATGHPREEARREVRRAVDERLRRWTDASDRSPATATPGTMESSTTG